MHIGFITSEYPHANIATTGGIGTSIKILGKALTCLKHSVTIYVYGQKTDNKFSDDGLLIVTIKNVKFKGFSWYLTRKKIQRIINDHNAKSKIDIVEAPDWTGITAFMHLKCPVVIKLHGSDTYFCHLENRSVKRWNYFLEKKALKTADAHISVSSFTARLTNKVFGLNIDYEVIHNGIGLRNRYEKHLEVPASNRILYVGTMIRKKGVLELPLIFNEVHKYNKNAELILVGGDSDDILTGSPSTWTLMKSLFSTEALGKVKYEGKKPHDKLEEYYRTSTVCVFPSFAEAFPISWLEAMSYQKAIVASDVGWACELIEDGFSGILCNPHNHQEFANNILELLDNKDLRSELGLKASERARDYFSSEIIAAKSASFYRKIVDF